MRLIKSIISLSLVLSAYSVLAESGATELQAAALVDGDQLTLQKIMADPDWMGNSPNEASWSVDGQSVFFTKKALGHSHQEHYQVQLSDKKNSLLSAEQALMAASQDGNKNKAKSQGVFIFQGDVYWTDYKSGEIRALTADEEEQSNAQFAGDTRISYMQGHKIFIYDLNNNLAQQIADFSESADPEKESDKSYLAQSQPRLLKTVEHKLAEDKFQKERKDKNRTAKNKTYFLGSEVEIRTFRLSPDANWLMLGTVEKSTPGKADQMPEFVTADGYVNNRNVRPLVGTSPPTNESFYLFDLKNQQKYALDTSILPGINDDPLDALKQKASKKIGYKYKALQQPRAIYAHNWTENGGVEWSENSGKVALLLYSYDNKDRWIVGMDVADKKLTTYHWMSDDAWVNDWTFNEFGWLPDNETLFYLSEEDGYSHLYIKTGKRRATQLTSGKWEVSDLKVSDNGESIYFRANKKHPGIYEIYRVAVKGGKIEALTNLGGLNEYALSPDETKLLILHSTTTQMPELYLQSVNDPTKVEQLTDSASAAFKAVKWMAPQIIEVPSSEIKRNIYSRFYAPQNDLKVGENQKKPAVVFVHGAGYLQNSHQGWSGYFREYMFHNLLARQGYAVLDMDYRASKGYGREWRTAIYQKMGTPELQDLTDGVKWLIDNANVDPERVGIYGGSYGGFMTFMALFKSPDLFAAGAALRPVSDWAHYNHGYTSNILNTPEVDPDAYERSSPIEFAEGLNKPLLIAHGMVDDNVFFKDSVRLVQRLIELEKTPYFETAIYPVEPHGFREAASWLDEYTRIYQLFDRHLN